MEHDENRSWMYNMFYENMGLRKSYVDGVDGFIAKAKLLLEYIRGGSIKCPCVKCKCSHVQPIETVVLHLYRKGFMPNYFVWTAHGECNPSVHRENFQNDYVGYNYPMNEMLNDAFGMYQGEPSQPNVEEIPNNEAKLFYEQLEEASRPFYEGASHSKLSVAVRLLSIKSDYNISQGGMDEIIGLLNELNISNLGLPSSYYDAKKLVSFLGLSSERIHCCKKGCMLYYKENKDKQFCTTHVLLNCPEVQPFYSLFVTNFGHDAVTTKFSEWFREYVSILVAHIPLVNNIRKYVLNEVGWVEPRAQQLEENYKALHQEWLESQGSQVDEGSPKPTQDEENAMFVQAGGGYTSKNRAYGLGPSRYKKPSRVGIVNANCSSSSSHAPQAADDELRARLAEMEQRLQDSERQRLEDRENVKKLQDIVAKIWRDKEQGSGSS